MCLDHEFVPLVCLGEWKLHLRRLENVEKLLKEEDPREIWIMKTAK